MGNLLRRLGLAEKPQSLEDLFKIKNFEIALEIGNLKNLERHNRAFILYGCKCAKDCIQYYERDTSPANVTSLRQILETIESYAYGRVSEEVRKEAMDEALSPHWSSSKAAYNAALAVGNAGFGWTAVGASVQHAACAAAFATVDDMDKIAGRLVYSPAWESISSSIWKAAKELALENPRYEFNRLCRLEAEYGEVDRISNP